MYAFLPCVPPRERSGRWVGSPPTSPSYHKLCTPLQRSGACETLRRRACGAGDSYGVRAAAGVRRAVSRRGAQFAARSPPTPYGVEGSLARATARRQVRSDHSPTGNGCVKKGAMGDTLPYSPLPENPPHKGARSALGSWLGSRHTQDGEDHSLREWRFGRGGHTGDTLPYYPLPDVLTP